MNAPRFLADDPREWLNRANSSLLKAQVAAATPGVYLEDVCFDAQQAAEKAIKAVLLFREGRFPYIHDLAQLLTLVEQSGLTFAPEIRRAVILSDYAVATRYPGVAEPVTREEYAEALQLAEQVVTWARNVIEPGMQSCHQRDSGDCAS
jgi:HEPN domain-containing protein